MLKAIIGELDQTMKGITEASLSGEIGLSIPTGESTWEEEHVTKQNEKIELNDAEIKALAEVDMQSDDEEYMGQTKEIDINDDKVKDRWSRYIGVMGIDAVAKQAKARILISGLGYLGAEIAKNIILAGCKELIIHDTENVKKTDLPNIFLSKADLGKNRAESSKKKL